MAKWLGAPPPERRFENVDEVYISEVHQGRLVSALGVEDNLSRLRHFAIFPRSE